MEKTNQNGDTQGETSVEDCEVAKEADFLDEEVNGKVKQITKQDSLDVASNEEVSQQVTEKTSDVGEDEEVEELSLDTSNDQINGEVSEEESTQESEELVSEELDVEESSSGKQEQIIEEIVEEIEIIEERQGQAEGANQSQKEEVEEQEEEQVVEKKKIKYVEEEVDDLDFSDGPDSQDPDLEQEEDSQGFDSQIAETEEDLGTNFTEEKREPEPAVEESDPEVEQKEEVIHERLQQKKDLVEEAFKTKEPIQSVQEPNVASTQKRQETKDHELKPDFVVPRRRSSVENFQKLKDRFSDVKLEENNHKNSDKEKRKSIETDVAQRSSAMSEGKKRFEGTSEKCTQCNKTVYPMEKMEVAGRLLHKTCFKCCKCNSQLNVGRFSIGGKDMYCMTHYKQAFREKGTYDVFTPDNPCKGKWENKA